MVKFTWQYNLPMEFHSTFKMPSRRMKFGAPLKLQSKQSKKWTKMAFKISYHTQLLCQFSAKLVDHYFWPLEHFLRQGHLKPGNFDILAVSQDIFEKQLINRRIYRRQSTNFPKRTKYEKQMQKKLSSNICKHFLHMPFNISNIFEHGELFW